MRARRRWGVPDPMGYHIYYIIIRGRLTTRRILQNIAYKHILYSKMGKTEVGLMRTQLDPVH